MASKYLKRCLFLFDTVILGFLTILKNCQASSKFEAGNSTWLSSCQRHVRPIFEMKWRLSQRVRSDWAANIMHYAIHSPLDHWNQKIDDVNSHLPHHQWVRRMSTNWSLSLWAIIIKLLISPSRLGHTVLRVFIYCGKFFKRWEYQTTLSSSWETCMQVEK